MSHERNQYDLGTAVRCSASFEDPDDHSAIDPTTVSVSVKDPSGTIVTKVYGTDTEVKKPRTGTFYIDVTANAVGVWHYRFFSTGTGQAAEENSFVVRRSQFD
jgi:hypothetical protein